MRCVRILVSGRVQGVGFRYFVAGEARALGLTGFVRNLPDGRVEAVATGAPERIEALAAACRRGPPASRVDALEISEGPDAPAATTFEIRR